MSGAVGGPDAGEHDAGHPDGVGTGERTGPSGNGQLDRPGEQLGDEGALDRGQLTTFDRHLQPAVERTEAAFEDLVDDGTQLGVFPGRGHHGQQSPALRARGRGGESFEEAGEVGIDVAGIVQRRGIGTEGRG